MKVGRAYYSFEIKSMIKVTYFIVQYVTLCQKQTNCWVSDLKKTKTNVSYLIQNKQAVRSLILKKSTR